jgi:hypothetical protein
MGRFTSPRRGEIAIFFVFPAQRSACPGLFSMRPYGTKCSGALQAAEKPVILILLFPGSGFFRLFGLFRGGFLSSFCA